MRRREICLIKDEYLKKLLKGKHTLLIKVQGSDVPIQVELVIE